MAELKTAMFAGGCLWCMVEPFDTMPGVEEVISVRAKNTVHNSESVDKSDYVEAVVITYNPEEMPYEELVEIYWRQTDPTDASGQFIDRGEKYRPVIYYADDNQREVAEESKQKLEESGRFSEPIVTSIEPVQPYTPSADEHQYTYKRNKKVYEKYAAGSGRREFIEKYWEEDND